LLLVGGLGVAAYLAYINNWFGSVSTPTTATAASPSIGTSNPVTNPNTQIVNAPSAPPPLGTVVTNGNDVSAQATAGYAYILPAAGINTSSPPTGYSVINTTDHGPIYLRNNVYNEVSRVINNRVQRAIAQGAAQTSIQNAGNESLQDVQTAMSSAGLTGFSYSGGW